MSLRLAPFKDSLTVEFRRRKAARKKKQPKRFRFSHLTLNGDAVFVNQNGERYTQAELRSYFGIDLPIPKKFRTQAAQRKRDARTAKRLEMELALIGD
jgi:hypothetical protein